MSIEIKCAYDKIVQIKDLTQHPKNFRKHSREQIQRFAEILKYQGIRRPIRVSRLSGFITSGHGLLAALQLLKSTSAPCNFQDYKDEDQEIADLVADNALSDWEPLDLSAINLEVPNLGPDFDINMLGLKDFKLDAFERELGQNTEAYIKKIEAPIYEPKGERPGVNELFNRSKAIELAREIEKSEIPDEIKSFLFNAAHRHTVFNYEKIAEFYAHADEATQLLMEKSALVIIDFKQAIENGFVSLSKEIAKAYHD